MCDGRMGKTELNGKKDKSSDQAGTTPKHPKGGNPHRDGFGDALKTIYGDTLREDIPAEMLALLGKLD